MFWGTTVLSWRGPPLDLVYIANIRLPTEKAHGYQIMKMCEAFARLGLRVALYHPRRCQVIPALQRQGPFEYYGLAPLFRVRSLPNLDVVWLERRIPHWLYRLYTALYFGHAILWGLYAALVARRCSATLYYTRDTPVAFWLTRLGLPTAYEAHVIPQGRERQLLRQVAFRPSLSLVVVLNRFIQKRLIQEGFDPGKIQILPDGVDLSLFASLPGRKEARCRLGIDKGTPLVAYTGHLYQWKGVYTLVRAAQRMPEVMVLIVGGTPRDAERLGEFIRTENIGNVQMAGHVPPAHVPLYLAAASVLVLPNSAEATISRYYTSPLKMFEYMAAERPIVASDLPSLREVLRNGENALLVPPDDPHALAEGVRHLLADPTLAKRLAIQARRDVEAYTWEQRAKRIWAFICNGATGEQ